MFRLSGLLLTIALVLAGCGEDATQPTFDISSESSRVAGHTHEATIPGRFVADPPLTGIDLQSTSADVPEPHTHALHVNALQLEDLGAGRTIDVETQESAGHRHVFLFQP